MNGRCMSPSLIPSQTKCYNVGGDGGREFVCDGYEFQQSSGFVIIPHVKLENGNWTATVEVRTGNSFSEYTPVFSGPDQTRYFTNADNSDTIGISVSSFGQFEQGKIGMVLDVQPRYGINPSLLNG